MGGDDRQSGRGLSKPLAGGAGRLPDLRPELRPGGAIDFFGGKYGLPKASCGHDNYWLWGPPDWDGKVAIVFGVSNDLEESTKDMAPGFETVEHVATFTHKHVMPYESNRPILVCRGAKGKIKDIWPQEKSFG